MTFGSRFGRGLVAAMEDEALDAAGEVETGADSAEAAVAEVTAVSSDIESATGDIDSAAADADTLDTIAEKVEATEETGGLSPEAAEVVEVAVEAIYARLGIRSNPIPALEGFSDTNKRVRTTHIAVENWKETVKKIWQAIINAFKKVYDFVVSFVKGIMDANGKLAKRANALLAAAKGVNGVAKEKEIAAGSFVKKLATKKGWSTADAIQATNTENNVCGVPEKGADIKGAVTDQKTFDSYTYPRIDKIPVLNDDAPEGFKWYGWMDLPGNKSIAILQPEKKLTGKEAWEAQRKVTTKIGVSNDKLELKTEKVETLSVDQINTIAKNALNTVRLLNSQKANIGTLESNLKNDIQAATNVAQQAPKDEGVAERSKLVSAAFSASTGAFVKVITQILAHNATLTAAGLDYAEKSLKQYESKADTK